MPRIVPGSEVDGQVVQIDIFGHYAEIRPALEADLQSLLTAPQRHFVTDDEHGFREVQSLAKYYAIKDDCLLVRAGLVPRIVDSLKRSGYRAEVSNGPAWSVLLDSHQALLQDQSLSADDCGLVQALSQQPRGQVDGESFADSVRCIELMGRLWPKANIVVVVASHDRAARLQAALSAKLERAVSRVPEISRGRSSQVYICPANNFPLCSADLWDVVVIDGARTAVSQQVFEKGLRMTEQLVYVVTSSDERLGQHERLRLEVLCGPDIHSPVSCREDRGSVRVALVRTPLVFDAKQRGSKHFQIDSEMLAVSRKRQLWHNEARNRTVADVADAVCRQDMPALWQHGILLHADEGYLAQWQPAPHVAILVESPEHARQLQRLLNGWGVYSCVPGPQGATDAPASFHPSIVTELYAHEFGIRCDVLVRASGGASTFPVETFARKETSLLIDLVDDSDQYALENTTARLSDYIDRGWSVTSNEMPHALTQ